jgi:heterodisulfide reductase subunit C
VSKLGSYAWLSWRAAVSHPLRALRRQGSGEERFLSNYAADGVRPTSVEDREVSEAASACIACGLCESSCALRSAIPAIRALGLHASFRLHAKSAALVDLGRESLAACAACTGCEPLCPTGVPISRIVRHLASRSASGGARDVPDAARREPGAAGR